MCEDCRRGQLERREKRGEATHFPVRERIDDHPQRTQTLVDLLSLLERLSRRARLANLLTPRQIDEEERARLLRAGLGVALDDGNDEDGVGAGGLGVHVCDAD